EHQQNSIMQPMTLSNAVQNFQASPSCSTNYIQENYNMVRHSFFYRPCNDDHIYQINCEETTFVLFTNKFRILPSFPITTRY
ncbi:18017_t:CDS:1, partial [Funneliformis geosporum]